MFFRRLLLLATLLAVPAWAQTISNFTTFTAPYVPLAGATTLTGTEVSDTLPFNFPYYGTNYSTAWMSMSGRLGFSSCGFNCTSTYYGIPSTSANGYSNGLLPLAGTYINPTFGSQGRGTMRRLSVSGNTTDVAYEWVDARFGYSFTTGASTVVSFMTRLSSTGAFLMHYGPMVVTGSSTQFYTVAGFLRSGGNEGAATMAGSGTCTASDQTGCCSRSGQSFQAMCVQAHFPQNGVVAGGASMDRELMVESVGMRGVTVGTNSLSFEVVAQVRNLGTLDATGVAWRAFISRDQVIDASDTEVGSGTGATVAAGSTVEVVGPGSFSGALPADFWLLFQVDPANTIAEAFELNNVGYSDTSYVSNAVDLVAAAVSGPANTNLSGADALSFRFFNRGLNSAGNVDYRVSLSTDGTMATRVVLSGRVAVGPGETVVINTSQAIGCYRAPGEYTWLLEVDPLGTIQETNEGNNRRPGNKTLVALPNLVPEAISVQDAVLKVPTRRLRFGDNADIRIRVRNEGRSNSPSYPYSILISDDTALSLPADTIACSLTGSPLNSMQSMELVGSCPLPLLRSNRQPFASGNYYLAVALNDPDTICEESRDNILVQPDLFRMDAPNPDFEASSLALPPRMVVGERAAVLRTIRNVGNRPVSSAMARAVKYRIVASANDIITSSDINLRILNADGTPKNAEVTLLAGEGDTGTDYVELPASMTPGSYFIGLLVDPDGTEAEIDEDNNALAAGPLSVIGGSFGIITGALPDATAGRSYQVRLSLTGELQSGVARWSLVEGRGTLPQGLTLNPTTGVISGTVASSERRPVAGFVVRAVSGPQQAEAALAIRILPPSSQLEITTTSVPFIPNSTSFNYEFQLAASGGVRPYSWTWRSRGTGTTLPSGLRLNGASGLISGRPPAGTGNVNNRVLFVVSDAAGNSAQREFTMRVVPPTGIAITTADLPPTFIGDTYTAQVGVAEVMPNPNDIPTFKWTVLGTLPPGLTAREDAEFLSISGSPSRAGVFTFTVGVTDNLGRSDTLDYTMQVSGSAYEVRAEMPAVLVPDQAVDVALSVAPDREVRYELLAGSLPPGITLSGNRLTGAATEEALGGARFASYTFTIRAVDSAGRSGLGAFALRVEAKPEPTGCAASAVGLEPLLLLGGLLPLLRRRRQGGVRARGMAVAVVVLLPALAFAQQYRVRELTGGYSAASVSGSGSGVVNLPTNFNFEFFGAAVSVVNIGGNGQVVMGNQAPGTQRCFPCNLFGQPTRFAACWWDPTGFGPGTQGQIRHGIRPGSNPREYVIQWQNFQLAGINSSRASVEMALVEGTDAVRCRYSNLVTGTAGTPLGTVGVHNAASQVGRDYVDGCSASGGSPNCQDSNWRGNRGVEFSLDPDLRIGSLSAPQTGYDGVDYTPSVTLTNLGGSDATNVEVTWYLSNDVILDSGDQVIGTATAPLVPAQQSPVVLRLSTGRIPGNTPQGSWWVLAQVDPGRRIPELDDNNNLATPSPITVRPRRPDLVGRNFVSPAMPTGGNAQVSFQVTNAGNAVSGAYSYTLFLSDNAEVTPSDTVLATKTASALAAGANLDVSETVTLPAMLPSGQFWLGACVNFNGMTFGPSEVSPDPTAEISIVNNCVSAPMPIVVSSGTTAVATSTLLAASLFSPYSYRLEATGGDGRYTWSVPTPSQLPTGITLSSSGELAGSPSVAGAFNFTVRVESAGQMATRMLTLTVGMTALPLVVVEQDLSAAEFGAAYSVPLIAIGGTPPYLWKVVEDTRPGRGLPTGLALSKDGFIEGQAYDVGERQFTVEVSDAAGVKSTSANPLRIRVVRPAALRFATRSLPMGMVDEGYSQVQLRAVGGGSQGMANYQFKVVGFQQQPENITEVPGELFRGDAAEAALDRIAGLSVQSGALTGIAKRAGLYLITFQVTDETTATDTHSLLLRIGYANGLAITTLALPDAFEGQIYDPARILTNSPDALGLTFELACIKQVGASAGEFNCLQQGVNQTLPRGIALVNGRIQGLPEPGTADEGTPPGVYAFLVKAFDDSGRQDIRSLSLRVRKAQTFRTGCAAAPGVPLVLLGGLLALGARRRRARGA